MDGGSVHSLSRTRSALTEEGVHVLPFALAPDGRRGLGGPFPYPFSTPANRAPGARGRGWHPCERRP